MLQSISVLHAFLLPNSIPLYGNITFYWSIHLLMDIWVLFTFWLLWTMLLWAFMYKCCVNMFSFLLGVYLGVESLGHMVTLCFIVWGTARMLSKMAAPFFIPLWVVYESSNFSTSLSTLVFICLLDYSHPREYEVASHHGFNVRVPDG